MTDEKWTVRLDPLKTSTKQYPIQLAGGNMLGFEHGKLHNFRGEK